MNKRFVLVVVAVLGVLVGSAAGYTSTRPGAHARHLSISRWSESTSGTPIAVGPGAAKFLAQFTSSRVGSLGNAFSLGQLNGRGLYRIDSASGLACYGAGPSAVAGQVSDFDIVECPVDPAFPSANRPVMDFSVLTTARGGSSYYSRVEGVAADGIKSIGLVDKSGSIILRVPVHANVYAFTPSQANVTGLVAFDAAGNSVSVQARS